METTETVVEKKSRPLIITVACVVGFLGAIATVPVVFSTAAKQIGAWYPPYVAASGIVGLGTMIGMWKMKRWSVLAYTGFALLNQIVLLAMKVWNVYALLIPAIVIAIGFSQYKKNELSVHASESRRAIPSVLWPDGN
jgi:hypothetical protein